MTIYTASVQIFKDGKPTHKISGVLHQLYVSAESVERCDGVIVWREPTGNFEATIIIEYHEHDEERGEA